MIFYVDGACSGNGTDNSSGAFGVVGINDEDQMFYWFYDPTKDTTNNREELKAILHVMRHFGMEDEIPIVYSDSAYIVNCYNQKWYKNWKYNGWVNSKREPVANKDLWEKLIPFFEDKDFIFTKVKGHNGVFGNEVVDTIAKQCITNMRNDKC